MRPTMTVTFAVENTLGKLAKWLRILGFDTMFDSGAGGLEYFRSVSAERVLLTRTRRVINQIRSDRVLFIHSDEPWQQLIEVIGSLGLQPGDVRPFTRCVDCNRVIEAVEKRSVCHRVPDFIYESHEHFQHCPRCRKVFWSGSHTSRVRQRIRHLFDTVNRITGQPASSA